MPTARTCDGRERLPRTDLAGHIVIDMLAKITQDVSSKSAVAWAESELTTSYGA